MEKFCNQAHKAQFKTQKMGLFTILKSRPENRGKYTLTYTENQVKILENIEISRKLGKSQDNEIKKIALKRHILRLQPLLTVFHIRVPSQFKTWLKTLKNILV